MTASVLKRFFLTLCVFEAYCGQESCVSIGCTVETPAQGVGFNLSVPNTASIFHTDELRPPASERSLFGLMNEFYHPLAAQLNTITE